MYFIIVFYHHYFFNLYHHNHFVFIKKNVIYLTFYLIKCGLHAIDMLISMVIQYNYNPLILIYIALYLLHSLIISIEIIVLFE